MSESLKRSDEIQSQEIGLEAVVSEIDQIVTEVEKPMTEESSSSDVSFETESLLTSMKAGEDVQLPDPIELRDYMGKFIREEIYPILKRQARARMLAYDPMQIVDRP